MKTVSRGEALKAYFEGKDVTKNGVRINGSTRLEFLQFRPDGYTILEDEPRTLKSIEELWKVPDKARIYIGYPEQDRVAYDYNFNYGWSNAYPFIKCALEDGYEVEVVTE